MLSIPGTLKILLAVAPAEAKTEAKTGAGPIYSLFDESFRGRPGDRSVD